METWKLNDETCNYQVIHGIKGKIYDRIWEWKMAYIFHFLFILLKYEINKIFHILVNLIILFIHLNGSNLASKWMLIIIATFQVTAILHYCSCINLWLRKPLPSSYNIAEGRQKHESSGFMHGNWSGIFIIRWLASGLIIVSGLLL